MNIYPTGHISICSDSKFLLMPIQKVHANIAFSKRFRKLRGFFKLGFARRDKCALRLHEFSGTLSSNIIGKTIITTKKFY